MPHLLDLFCGAGGAAKGYQMAGWTVVGVDREAQPYYPGKFVRAEWDKIKLGNFDAIHASPPCQAFSALNNFGNLPEHVNLIDEVREMLIQTNLPYIIENVPGAPLLSQARFCGQFFGLRVRRHRNFETNWPLTSPTPDCSPYHKDKLAIAIYGHHFQSDNYVAKNGGMSHRAPTIKYARESMGIDWPMPWHGLTQAVPPKYTEYIGGKLLEHLCLVGRSAVNPV